jgi:hypothetical protein
MLCKIYKCLLARGWGGLGLSNLGPSLAQRKAGSHRALKFWGPKILMHCYYLVGIFSIKQPAC